MEGVCELFQDFLKKTNGTSYGILCSIKKFAYDKE